MRRAEVHDDALSEKEDVASGADEAAAPKGSALSRWTASTLAAFESPVFRMLWFGSFIGFLAFNMSGTAQGVVAYDLTGSNRSVGIVMFGQGLAMLLLNPFGGALADRLNKRLLLLITQTVIGLVVLATGLLLQFDRISIAFLAMGAFTTGAMFAFLGPTRSSMLGESVPRERVGNAMALLQVGGNFGRICAPFLAGALLSWSLLGASGTYFVIAGAFIFVILFMSRIPDVPSRPTEGRSVIQDIKLGFAYARNNAYLFHAIIGYYALTALGFSFFVLTPGFVIQELGGGTAQIGAMLGFASIGGLIGSVAVASQADSARAPMILKIGAGLSAVGLIGVGLAPSLALALALMLVAGAGLAAFQTLNSAIALRRTDPAYYGRVMGLMQIAWGLIHLVSLPTGALADLLGERTVLSGAGVLLLGVIFLLAMWERRLR